MTIYSEAALAEINERVTALEALFGHPAAARATYLGTYDRKRGTWSGSSVAETRQIIDKLSESPGAFVSGSLAEQARELKRRAERINAN